MPCCATSFLSRLGEKDVCCKSRRRSGTCLDWCCYFPNPSLILALHLLQLSTTQTDYSPITFQLTAYPQAKFETALLPLTIKHSEQASPSLKSQPLAPRLSPQHLHQYRRNSSDSPAYIRCRRRRTSCWRSLEKGPMLQCTR